MVVYSYNPNDWMIEVGKSGVQGHYQVHSE